MTWRSLKQEPSEAEFILKRPQNVIQRLLFLITEVESSNDDSTSTHVPHYYNFQFPNLHYACFTGSLLRVNISLRIFCPLPSSSFNLPSVRSISVLINSNRFPTKSLASAKVCCNINGPCALYIFASSDRVENSWHSAAKIGGGGTFWTAMFSWSWDSSFWRFDTVVDKSGG